MPSVNFRAPRGLTERAFKARRAIGDPISTSKSTPRFIAPPPPTRPNLPLSLGEVLDVTAIEQAGQLVFHMVGDTGGVYGTDVEDAVAAEMVDGTSITTAPASRLVPRFSTSSAT